MFAHGYEYTCLRKPEVSGPQELDLQAIVSHLIWMLESNSSPLEK